MSLKHPTAIALLALLALSGCASTASNNTSYARPAETGGLQIPLN